MLTPRPAWSGTLERRGGACLMPTYARYPIEIAGGRGCRVMDSAGRTYLDFAAGIAVNVLGHAHPALVRALRGACEGLLHTSNLYWTEPMVRLAERLTETAGMERVFFCNSGAEAVEAAIKTVRRARPGREKIVVFERSFHGRTLGALSATAQPQYQEGFAPLVPGFEAIPFGDFDAATASVDETTQAVLVEPIQGEGGVRPAPRGWLRHLRTISDRAGALLILDEVQCGVGRTGSFFAHQEDEIAPDAVVAAKGLAGGLPIGALLTRGDAAQALGPGQHGSTFGGGAFVATAAHAVLDVVLGPGFLDEVRAKGEVLQKALEEIARRREIVTEVRGRGLFRGVVLREPWAKELVASLHELGMLAVPAGNEVLRLLPPLVISREEIDEGVVLLDRALAAVSERPRAPTGTRP